MTSRHGFFKCLWNDFQGENKKQLSDISYFLNRNHCIPLSVLQSHFEPWFYPGNPGISPKLLYDTMQKFPLLTFY